MTIRVHHLNCATMRPPTQRLINGIGSWIDPGHMVAHCLLAETNDGLVLIDSGIGTRDIAAPERRLGSFFVKLVRPALDPAEAALRQVEALGFKGEDVRHIVLTHLDVDHAGGLADFPHAEVHVCRAEHDAAMQPTWRERERYRTCHWEHGPRWQLHDVDGERFMGLEAVRAIVEPEVLLVPLAGHSRGHAAVALNSPRGWLLHCGDAYFNKGEMNASPSCPAGLQLFQTVVASDNALRLRNQQRLRDLKRDHDAEVGVFSAHDGDELTQFVN
jgi:glyoxylase-like metal-dependent hydrolase (beta-lactamase superfamily II)